MKIAVIGTGRVGSVLGSRWAEAGHVVTFGSRRAGSDELSHLLKHNASVALPLEAVKGAEVVVIATPWSATQSAIASLGSLDQKIVVDCTNPVGPDFKFLGQPGASGGEQVAEWAKGARVVKAFNTTGAKNMAMPEIEGHRLAMFICGDDGEAKQVVASLAEALGFAAIDNGSLSQAHFLESMAMIWIAQAFQQGWGPDFGVAVLRRA